MKNFLEKKYVQIGVTAFCVIAASLLFYFGIFHTASITKGLKAIYNILTPIVYAAAISYVLAAYPFYGEKYYLSDLWKKELEAVGKSSPWNPDDLCDCYVTFVFLWNLWIAVYADSGID